MIKATKNITIGLVSAVLLTACSNSQESVTTPSKVDKNVVYNHSAVATDATDKEIKKEVAYEKHIQKVKKRKKAELRKAKKKEHIELTKTKKRKKIKLKKKKIDLKKFCFKDNRSIHYRIEERCK